ncbi:ATP-binding protein [Streptomyces sp. NPDC008079]|uniref:ATP-binding protein n=1 Tax=Streptomyces sp. NPDC008079 TaxID=3364806 RepID=UPI0036ECEB13
MTDDSAALKAGVLPAAVSRFFDAKRESVGLAREFAAGALRAWGLSPVVDDVRLCVSELASNALAHGTRRGHGFLVRVVVGDGCVRLEVHDSRDEEGERRPRVCEPGAADVRGRGLLIVAAVADGWGVEGREPFGKVVWARFKGVASGPAGGEG